MPFLDNYVLCERTDGSTRALCFRDASVFGLAAIGVLSSILILRWNLKDHIQKKTESRKLICPLVDATLQSRLFFDWASPLLRRGYITGIIEGDLWD
jgi:hypothetical protein